MQKVVPFYVERRHLQLVGRASSTLATTSRRREEVVQALIDTPGCIYCTGSTIGHAVVSIGSTRYTAVLGDMSCTCSYAGKLLFFAVQG